MANPALSGLSDATFDENTVNTTPQLLAPSVTFTDADNDFTGGRVVVSGLLAEDRIGFAGDSFLWVAGGYLQYDNNGSMPGGLFTIGTVTGGVGGTFTIEFNLPASSIVTAALMDTIIQRLTYGNVSDTPTATRDLTINVVDAAGNDLFGPPVVAVSDLIAMPQGEGFVDVSYTELVDIDGDGDLDLFVGQHTVDGAFTALRYFVNEGNATAWDMVEVTGTLADPFVGIAGADYPSIDYPAPTFGDLDNDGDMDAIISGIGGQFRYFRNDGTAASPAFTQVTGAGNPLNGLTIATYNVPELADIDGDGDLDLIVGFDNGTDADGTLRYFRNTGTASTPVFTEQVGAANPFEGIVFPKTSNAPAAGDIDGDGDLDLIVGDGRGYMHYLENVGTATAPSYVLRSGADNPFGDAAQFGSYTTPTLGDVDGDGDLDILAGNGGNLRFWLNNTPRPPVITVTVNAQDEGPTNGDDEVPGTTGDDTLEGLGGDDEIDGGDGDDFLDGGAGTDNLIGGQGDDYLRGGAGDDIMTGGVGNDTYVVTEAGDSVSEAGGDGIDLVRSSVSFTLGAGLENLDLLLLGAINGTGNGLNNVINGNAAQNTILGLGGDDTLSGGGQNDILDGGDGADTLDGGSHNDELYGGAAADILLGGLGNDVLDGGTGNDQMTGGLGNDTYIVDSLGDVVTELASGGTDTVVSAISWVLGANLENLTLDGFDAVNGTGNALRNTIIGSDAGNTIWAGDELDTVYGGEGDDTLFGQNGADVLYGENGKDLLIGDAGNDTLYGGAGEDYLDGGAGSDKMTGGAGADTFRFSGADITATVSQDQILDLDFSEGDVVDLSSIDANSALAGDQAFSFVSRFTKVAGQATLTYANGVTTIALDVNGDGAADLRIAITGEHTDERYNLYTGAGDTDGGWLL